LGKEKRHPQGKGKDPLISKKKEKESTGEFTSKKGRRKNSKEKESKYEGEGW